MFVILSYLWFVLFAQSYYQSLLDIPNDHHHFPCHFEAKASIKPRPHPPMSPYHFAFGLRFEFAISTEVYKGASASTLNGTKWFKFFRFLETLDCYAFEVCPYGDIDFSCILVKGCDRPKRTTKKLGLVL